MFLMPIQKYYFSISVLLSCQERVWKFSLYLLLKKSNFGCVFSVSLAVAAQWMFFSTFLCFFFYLPLAVHLKTNLVIYSASRQMNTCSDVTKVRWRGYPSAFECCYIDTGLTWHGRKALLVLLFVVKNGVKYLYQNGRSRKCLVIILH